MIQNSSPAAVTITPSDPSGNHCKRLKAVAVFSINTDLMAMLRHLDHICMLLFLTTGWQSATKALLQLKRRISTTERYILNFVTVDS